MPIIERKQEISSLDGTPEKRLFWSIISDYDLKAALAELIDNAVDLWMADPARKSLAVFLELDADRQMILLSDNAGGVRQSDLRLLITPGGSSNSPDKETIGIFGVGSKRAVIAVAEHVVIKTHFPEDGSFQIDITKDWLESGTWELPAYAIPDIPAGTTTVELSQLRKPLRSDDIGEIMAFLSDTYSNLMTSPGFEIIVNSTHITPRHFDIWAYPPGHEPQRVLLEPKPDGRSPVKVDITGGLIRDRLPDSDNYGVYFYCNRRLIAKDVKVREVGYYVSADAGVPHPDASLCRVIVRMSGPAKLMPWSSTKGAINFGHPTFIQIQHVVLMLIRHFTKLSRALKDDWTKHVFKHDNGDTIETTLPSVDPKVKLVLPPLPKVNKPRVEQLKNRNKTQLHDKPWTIGLVEAMTAVDVVMKQKFDTRSRIALILLDSNFEIALKEFIVHNDDLFPGVNLKKLFESRIEVIKTVTSKVHIDSALLNKAKYYYGIRNKFIHERASATISDTDVEIYRDVIEKVLATLFQLKFD